MGVKKRYILVRGTDWWIGPRAYRTLMDRFAALDAQMLFRQITRTSILAAKGSWRTRIERLYAVIRHYDASYRLQIKKSHAPDANYKVYIRAAGLTPGRKPLEQ